jgi:type VI secretion system secreted protein Hcp
MQRFRFRVVAPDGRELLSEIVSVQLPPLAGSSLEWPVSEIFVAVKGKTQGKFAGESAHKGKEHQFAALALDYHLLSPRDRATGQASGRRQHSPVSIVKEWGAATPKLLQALAKNEALESVEIDCWGQSKAGEEVLVHKVKLTNATVASIRQVGSMSGTPPVLVQLETVAFTFEKIEHISPHDAVVASDSWRVGG